MFVIRRSSVLLPFVAMALVLLAAACGTDSGGTPAATSTPVSRTTATPAHTVTPERRTSIPVVDRVIDAAERQDADALMSLVRFTSLACTTRQGSGGPPLCPPGAAEGTPVDVVFVGTCEGEYRTTKAAVRDAVERSFAVADASSVYAVLRAVLPGSGSDGYVVATAAGANASAGAPGTLWYVALDGAIVGLRVGCGPTPVGGMVQPSPQAPFILEPQT